MLETLASWAQILSFPVALVALVLQIVAMVRNNPTVMQQLGWWATIAAIALVAFSAGLWVSNTSGSQPEVTITFPRDGETVAQSVDVQGTAANIPADRIMWLCLLADYGKYFCSPTSKIDDVNWRAAEVKFGEVGGNDQSGRQYRIGILLTDATGDVVLQQKASDLDNPPLNSVLIPLGVVTRQ